MTPKSIPVGNFKDQGCFDGHQTLSLVVPTGKTDEVQGDEGKGNTRLENYLIVERPLRGVAQRLAVVGRKTFAMGT